MAGLREPLPHKWMPTGFLKATFGPKLWLCRTMFWVVMRAMVAKLSYLDVPFERHSSITI